LAQQEAAQVQAQRLADDARNLSLQIALLVPVIAGLLGLANSFRMVRLPDIAPAGDLEGMDFG
jgi:hypothetical protein